jgi:hypothetical protein
MNQQRVEPGYACHLMQQTGEPGEIFRAMKRALQPVVSEASCDSCTSVVAVIPGSGLRQLIL